MKTPKLFKIVEYMYHLHKRNFKIYLKTPLIPKCDPLKLNSIHWIGHATTLINLEGKILVTDPVTNLYLGQIKRLIKPSLDLSKVHLDYILISHGHMDHLDRNTLNKLDKNTSIICPKQYKMLLNLWGFKKIYTLMPGETFIKDNIKITAYKAKHDGKRYALGKYSPCNSYLIKGQHKSVFFAGDTAYTNSYKNLECDIALMPVGCYIPKEYEKMHCNPIQAFKMFKMMNCKLMIPIHYKTYILAQDQDQDTINTLKTINDGTIKIIDIGQTINF